MRNINRLTWLRSRLTFLGVSKSHPGRLSFSRFLALIPTGDACAEYAKRSFENVRDLNIQMEAAKTPSNINYDRIYDHVRTTPLLDLLSVSVSSDKCRKDKHFEVYGNIQLIDVEQNHAYNVFSRPYKNPYTVLSSSNLLLTDPNGICTYLHVPSVPAFKMRVNLKDAATHGKVIANGDFDLQFFDHKDGLHERVVTQVVRGCNGNFASVQYATLPHAVLATVNLMLTKIDATGSASHAHIYGCISATSKVRQGENISSVLLNKTPSDPMMVKVGKPIRLTRPMLAVPAYSSLEVKADLWDHHTNQQIASGVILANCEAQDENEDEDGIVRHCVLGEIYHFQVEVCWDNAFVPQITPTDQQSSSALSYMGSLVAKDELLTSSPEPSLSGSPMVEVFSVTISPDSDLHFCFCGTIEVFDNSNLEHVVNPFVMFEHTKSDAEMLNSDMTIKFLKWPICPFEGNFFKMRLDLYDKTGLEVCSGVIDWTSSSVIFPIPWYGKLISSVIRGKHGYATVHYAMFPNAVQADVYAAFKLDNSSRLVYMVIGDISARYSCFTYSSDAEKKFFQNKLLTSNNKSVIYGGCAIPLEKTVVAVPVNSSLILDMDLHVGVMGKTTEGVWFSKHYGSLKEAVDFKFDIGYHQCYKSVAGEGFHIDLTVRWKEIDINEKWKHFRTLESDLLSRCQPL